jgi:hypothetical protein
MEVGVSGSPPILRILIGNPFTNPSSPETVHFPVTDPDADYLTIRLVEEKGYTDDMKTKMSEKAAR